LFLEIGILVALQRNQQQQTNQIPVQQLELLRQIFGTIPTGGGGGQLRENPGLLGQLGASGQGIGATATGLGNIGTAINGAGGLAGIGSSLASLFGFSDVRLKERVDHIGENNGHNIYEFSYRAIPGRRFVGVLAHEVQEYAPEAIHEHESGYLMVDYGRLGIEMREVV